MNGLLTYPRNGNMLPGVSTSDVIMHDTEPRRISAFGGFLVKLTRLNWPLFLLLLGLCYFSFIMVSSATATATVPDIQKAPRMYVVFVPLGVIGFFVLALVDYKFWVKMAPFIGGIMLFLLIFVLLPTPWTTPVNNAKSWIRLPGLGGIQPAELSKVAYIICFALFLKWREKKITRYTTFIFALGFTAIPLLLILRQPDFGSAMVFFPIMFIMMFVAGVPVRYLGIIVAIGIYIIAFCYMHIYRNNDPVSFLKPHQIERIKTFFDPEADPKGAGWNVRQSLIAIGSGGLEGSGIGNGPQTKYGNLPRTVSYNDFIFAVIGEELGFKGALGVLCVLAFILLTCLWTAAFAGDNLGAMLASGVAALLFTHIFINAGMTMQAAPVTGIPLPFISYGGTFLIVCLTSMGLVQSVWIHRKPLNQT
ncbi:rod shape-determining protein RodA [Verrucomicrobia bacterium LW23]|nr:rod shape-determining protein RodA [Verrucomicrobia bacterium LW23]